MTTQLDGTAPDGLARRLAGHYAASVTGSLATLYWTGQVLPRTGAERALDQAFDRAVICSLGNRDGHAILAELRALADYCTVHEGRGEVPGWREWTPERRAESRLVVPWGWEAMKNPLHRPYPVRCEDCYAVVGEPCREGCPRLDAFDADSAGYDGDGTLLVDQGWGQ